MWFLSNFSSNFIFLLIKQDYVTRTQQEAKSSAKYISNNEVVFSDNSHYCFLLFQIWLVFLDLLANLVLFNLYQACRLSRRLT